MDDPLVPLEYEMTQASSRICGSSEMAECIRKHDWSASPLGPIATWSDTLIATVNLMLASPNTFAVFWGPAGLLLYNDEYRGLLHEKHPSALGKRGQEVWAEAWDIIGPQIRKAFEHESITSVSEAFIPILAGGKLRDGWFTYSFHAIYENGRVVGVGNPSREDTALIESRSRLTASEEQAGRVLQSIGDAVIVTNAQTHVVRMNVVAEALTGWTMAEAAGRQLADVFRIVSGDTRDPLESPADKVRRLEAVVGIANHAVLIGKDGQETHIDDSAAPIRKDAGELTGVVLVFRDIRERREAERKRELLTEQLTQIQEATTDAILSIDRNWTVTYLNGPARKAVGPLSETVGKNFWKEYPDTIFPNSPFVEHYERAMNEEIGGEFEAYYPEPLNIWVHVRVRPTRDGIVLFFQDITETKRALEALLQTEKLAAVGRLSASIAHEINNPLESVTNLLYLARTSGSMHEVQEYLDTAERELRRVSVITNQTLRFHKQSTAPQQVTCTELFESALSIYQSRLLNSRIEVEKRKRAYRAIECFEGEIRQVLNNLVGNAIDALPPQGGRVLVRSRDATDWRTGRTGVTLTIADTGTGMPPQVLRRIFEAFYTTKGIGGTGLGLWVSKEIIERHHGRLLVRSTQKEGQSGTVFTLFLPLKVGSR